MVGKCIHPKETFPVLVIAGSMPDQEQADKVEQCRLFRIIHFERFESPRDCLEHLLITERNSHKGRVNGTNVTTHKIGARTLTQVGKVCRMIFKAKAYRRLEERLTQRSLSSEEWRRILKMDFKRWRFVELKASVGTP